MADTDPNASGAPDPNAEAALKAAREAIASLGDLTSSAGAPAAEASPAEAEMPPPPEGSSPMPLPTFQGGGTAQETRAIELLSDVNLNVKIELGRTRMLVEDVLKLAEGAVVELDKLAGDPVDVYVNDRHVAKGEVLVLNDNFCVRIHEIVKQPDGAFPKAG